MNWLKQNWIALVAGVMLLLAIPSIWPYAYFQLLRWVVTGAAACIAYRKYELGSTFWMWLMIATGILFNPIIPFYFDKSVWVVIDIITAAVFFASTFIKKQAELKYE